MNDRFSFFLLLCVAFFDYIGVGLVIPLFSTILFDTSYTILPPEASSTVRGVWMGVLVAISPLVQFLLSPVLGTISDQRGRKKTILVALAIGGIGYLLGCLGILFSSLALLIVFRALFGVCAATMPVVQAAIADMSTEETKGRNFAFYNMALGMGFTLGPFLGGVLSQSDTISWFGPALPLLVALGCTLLNLVLLQWRFAETRVVSEKDTKIDFLRGFSQARQAFTHPILRYAFLGFFFYVLGWDYFSDFISVTLVRVHGFSIGQVGNFYAYMGVLYASFAALLVKHIIKRFSTKNILFFSTLLAGPYLLSMLGIQNPVYFWTFFPPMILIISLFYPVASTYVSDAASKDEQGELLGVYHSVQSLALFIAPLFAGSLVGIFPRLPIVLGGGSMLLGGLVFAFGRLRERAHQFDNPS
jgi:DHA1 family tetracycline resistance protein-like MFS transporter